MKVTNTPGQRSIVAVFPDDDRARAALTHLRGSGIPGQSMSIARRAVPPPSEAPVLSRVFWSGFWWSVIGGAAGALVGVVIGAMGWGVPGTQDNIGIQVASWAMFAHVLGALIGCYAALDTGDRFVRKADHHDTAATLLRVTGAGQSVIRAERLLRDAGATNIEHRRSDG